MSGGAHQVGQSPEAVEEAKSDKDEGYEQEEWMTASCG